MSVCGIHFATKLNEDGSCDECDDLLRVENERDQLRTEIVEQKKTIKEQGESIGALMAKGISDCTARDKRIEELEGWQSTKLWKSMQSKLTASEQRVKELEACREFAIDIIRELVFCDWHEDWEKIADPAMKYGLLLQRPATVLDVDEETEVEIGDPIYEFTGILASPITGEKEPVDKIKEVCEDLFLKLSTVKKVTVDRGITVSIETDTDNEHDLEVIYDTELTAYDRLPGESIEFKVVPSTPTGDDTEASQ